MSEWPTHKAPRTCDACHEAFFAGEAIVTLAFAGATLHLHEQCADENFEVVSEDE